MKNLKTALNALNATDDGHWNKKGQPDLNHLTEAVGTKITRAIIKVAGFGDLTRARRKEEAETSAANAKTSSAKVASVADAPAKKTKPAPKTVKVRITDWNESGDVPLSVNGRRLKIPVGPDVDIPADMIDALNNSGATFETVK